jgi:hypothetical protein
MLAVMIVMDFKRTVNVAKFNGLPLKQNMIMGIGQKSSLCLSRRAQ